MTKTDREIELEKKLSIAVKALKLCTFVIVTDIYPKTMMKKELLKF